MGEIETETWVGREVAIRIAVRRRLDLDDARALFREQTCCIRAGHERRAFNDGYVAENLDRHENLSGANVS
jgi:hypothetical protein